jgi:hypothetical protein
MPERLRKLGWFVLLYLGGLAVISAVAFAIRSVLL